MTYSDALNDTATFTTITYSQNSVGGQEKNEAALYTSIPCRLATTNSPRARSNAGESEHLEDLFVCQVAAAYNGANKGDRVEIGSSTFLIVKKHEVKGPAGIHHVVYYLEEQE